MCVRVCVCERERERERGRGSERESIPVDYTQRENVSERERSKHVHARTLATFVCACFWMVVLVRGGGATKMALRCRKDNTFNEPFSCTTTTLHLYASIRTQG